MPTQLALVFFGILHVPLNVSLDHAVDTIALIQSDTGPCTWRVIVRR